jgi:hypothetical protein
VRPGDTTPAVLAVGRGVCGDLTGGLLPPRLCLAVVHDQVTEVQPPGRAEVQQAPVDSALKGNRRVTERAEGDDDRHPAHGIVSDLVPDQDLHGIGPRVGANLQGNHGLNPSEPVVGLADADEAALVKGGDAILRRPAREDLAIGHRMSAEVRREHSGGAVGWLFVRQQMGCCRRWAGWGGGARRHRCPRAHRGRRRDGTAGGEHAEHEQPREALDR